MAESQDSQRNVGKISPIETLIEDYKFSTVKLINIKSLENENK